MHGSITFGLLSAFAYGAADYLPQRAGRSVGAWRASFYYYAIGFIALSTWLAFHFGAVRDALHAPTVTYCLAVVSGL